MKIVTYNINGLRPRVLQFGSLLKLLDSLDSDIICFQETKLSRQDLTADLLIANGYECFFSCTRTSDKGRVSYSGVATFCRVKSAFLSNEVALPIAAEEGVTGVLESFKGSRNREDKRPGKAEGLEEFTKEELLKVDNEGRCVITDHGHFVLFNIYAPRAVSDDAERIQFKLAFFTILQKRWEFLLHQGRRVLVVGDLNIAPAAMDSCNPEPDFEKNEFRRWFRSMLVENGGNFFDVFRAKHPERKEAYTHFSQNTGAEEFNYGSRIDHILSAGPCLHEDGGQQGHNFVTCHVKECDIMTQFKRCRPGSSPRWKAGRNIKLEGSDHVPVYLSLVEIPDILQHGTSSLSARYAPEVRGFQQTIVSVLMKRQVAAQDKTYEVPNSLSDENITDCNSPFLPSEGISYSSNLQPEGIVQRTDEHLGGSSIKTTRPNMTASGLDYIDSIPGKDVRKKARQSQWSQLSLKSFFHITSKSVDGHDNSGTGISVEETDVSKSNRSLSENLLGDHEQKQSESNDCASTQDHGDPLLGDHDPKQSESNDCASTQDPDDLNTCCSSETEKSNVALLEWQRIRQLMQNSIPLCKGHREPCVARVVKKAGPNFGRRFYVCARAEVALVSSRCTIYQKVRNLQTNQNPFLSHSFLQGPASNPETNCGYFKWAASKPKGQR